MGLLGDIYSAIDTKKRQVKGLLDDFGGTVDMGVRRFREDQQNLQNLFANAYPMAGDKTVLNSPQQIAQFQREAADKAGEMGLAGATVWHGSPHKFDKFDSSKIGTGEGAQAYGHGLYLAESPAVAGQYQKELGANVTVNGKPFYDQRGLKLSTTGDSNIDDYILAHHGDMDKAIADAIEGGDEAVVPALQALKKSGAVVNQNTGSLYKVDLPDELISKMLDWDKPLSEGDMIALYDKMQQTPQTGFAKAFQDNYYSRMERKVPATDGQDLFMELSKELGGQKQVSDYLKTIDVPGIKYLDQGSRGAGTGSSNFVVFPGNEGLLNIMEHNGKPVSGLLK